MRTPYPVQNSVFWSFLRRYSIQSKKETGILLEKWKIFCRFSFNMPWKNARKKSMKNVPFLKTFFCCSVLIRGDVGEEAVLCTDNATYEVKTADTSNLLMLLPNLKMPKSPGILTSNCLWNHLKKTLYDHSENLILQVNFFSRFPNWAKDTWSRGLL